MQIPVGDANLAPISDTLELATWNVERSSEQLRSFISAKAAALPVDIEL